jgi:hypothetical protein
MISGEEFAARLQVISELRDIIIGVRQAAYDEYRQGKSPYRPAIDVRSDYEYWTRLAEDKGLSVPSQGDGDEKRPPCQS